MAIHYRHPKLVITTFLFNEIFFIGVQKVIFETHKI